MPILTLSNLKALRRVQSDLMLNKEQLSKQLNMSNKTAQKLTKSVEPVRVKDSTYLKVIDFITDNY